MFDWLRRKRLSNEARRTLLLVAARSEEALLQTHVANVLHLLDRLDGEVTPERGLELYAEIMSLDEESASAVYNRTLARLENTARGSR